MCGIYASLSLRGPIHPTQDLEKLLCNRGPDHLGKVEAEICINEDVVNMCFKSSVLALRGGDVTRQPLTDHLSKSVLCWNGEAWMINHDLITGNDGEAILNLLTSSTLNVSKSDSITRVLEVIHSISGPFAFIYFDQSHELLYFGRDCLGRRSLLFNAEDVPGVVQFSSIAENTGDAWREVEADGVYVISFSNTLVHSYLTPLNEGKSQPFCFTSYRTLSSTDILAGLPDPLGTLNLELPLSTYDLNEKSSSVKQLQHRLHESLRLRVLNIPNPPKWHSMANSKLAILFSGGLDCTLLARMVHDLLPWDEQIDLLNVAFENPRVVQAAKSRPQLYEHAKTIQSSAYEACPDRITGRKALKELREICPGRIWRLVEINIPYTEAKAHRSSVVKLMYPHNTEMDLSIAYALYFGARGIGQASTENEMEPIDYTTSARVLLSGLGADELFGGYTRHATAFERKGFPGLLSELELDVNRLGKRNLGRDDRVIANWGREARYPYLDESFVKWALELPVWCKCGFGPLDQLQHEIPADLEPGKEILRLLARQLGMPSVAMEKKRAIQFGARTAKMETGRTKGTSHIA